jgi:meso-butanediol dehydrogenase/(S,S)-butanediol dehydrogenase/diacetyl reductase
MKMLESKVALVTGAGQGVGQGIAFALAEEGAKIAAAGRTLAKLEKTCSRIRDRVSTY